MRANAAGDPLWDMSFAGGSNGVNLVKASDGGMLLSLIVSSTGEPRNDPILPSDDILLIKFSREGVSPESIAPRLRFLPGRTREGAWSFFARVGGVYEIESSSDLAPDSWQTLVVLQGDGTDYVFPGRQALGARQYFFRLRYVPP